MIVRNIKAEMKGTLIPKHNQRYTFGDDPDVYITLYKSDCTNCALHTQTDKCVLVDCATNDIRFIKQTQKL